MADSLRRLVALLRQLPGVGEKTASRWIFHLLAGSPEYGRALSQAILDVVENIHPCSICGKLTEIDPCALCTDGRRDKSILCVVEKEADLLAIENTHEFKGLYHVLQGVLDPLSGIGPDQVRIDSLKKRLPGEVREVIVATSASVEGEATALYLKKQIESLGIKVSRIASGIPVGGELEYTDRSTIGRALSGRREM